MKVLASVLAFAGLSIALLGCGGSGGETTAAPSTAPSTAASTVAPSTAAPTTPSPTGAPPPASTTTEGFQYLGVGACRAGADGTTPPAEADFDCLKVDGADDAAKAAACQKACEDQGTCKGYEITTAVSADSKCKKATPAEDETCELHKKIVTGATGGDGAADPHPAHKCFRKVNLVDFGKGGACRTAANTPGTFECHELDADGCRDLCLESKDCTAYETTEQVAADSKCKVPGGTDKKCEIHSDPITQVDKDASHSTHQCVAANPVAALAAEATYVV